MSPQNQKLQQQLAQTVNMSSSPQLPLPRSKQRVSQLCAQILSPKSGHIRHRVSQLRNLLVSQQQDNNHQISRLKQGLETITKQQALLAQHKQLDLIESLNREVGYMAERLQASEDKAIQYKTQLKRVQGDLEKVMEVNRALQGRWVYSRDRLAKIISRFRKDFLPISTNTDQVPVIQSYILHLQSLLHDFTSKSDTESTLKTRISKQLDSLITKYKALQSENMQLSQQLDIQTKQRQIELLDVNRIKEHFNETLVHEQIRLKKALEGEIGKVREKANRRKEKNMAMRADMADMERQLRKAAERQVVVMEQLEDCHSQMQSLGQEAQALKGMLAEARKQMSGLEDQHERLKGKLAEVERELMMRTAEAQEYNDLLKKTANELESQIYQCKGKEERILELERKEMMLQESITRLQKQFNNQEEQNNKLMRENKHLKDSVDDLKRLVSRQDETILKYKKQKDQMSYAFESQIQKLKRKEIQDRINSLDLDRVREEPVKKQSDRNHKLKVIGQLQSMVKTHKQLYQSGLAE